MLRILIVDDDPAMRRLVRRLLEYYRAGEVVEAGDGAEAVAVLREEPVDGMVVDLEMPNLGGLELVRALRASGAWQALPVLVLTARTDREEILTLRDLGVHDYLLKPLNPARDGARLQGFLAALRQPRARPA